MPLLQQQYHDRNSRYRDNQGDNQIELKPRRLPIAQITSNSGFSGFFDIKERQGIRQVSGSDMPVGIFPPFT